MIKKISRYNFLLRYLIVRDFKVKYRRSVLGVLWSVLNPLLMMFVVSSVFSYVFRFNIENFPAYLILGQVFFNVLSESTNVSMTAIIGSASLIKKVYIPKYIFPLEKVLFSFINFLISFIAVAVVLSVYKIPIHLSILYLPLILIYLLAFCLGISFLLSTVAVFFRDTLHLYSVVLTAWSYLTPIFYPAEALSPQIMTFMRLNPMYHFIRYFRNIVLYGEIPSLYNNFVCMGFAAISLTIGLSVFYKNQDKFILHI